MPDPQAPAPIDYAALAAQARGASTGGRGSGPGRIGMSPPETPEAPIDYAALADQARKPATLPPDLRKNPHATPPSAESMGGAPTTFQRIGQAVGPYVEGLDIRTPTGRRNAAGAAGAAAGLALMPETGGLSLVGSSLLGAAAGGASAEFGEQTVGTHPRSALNIAGAAGEQAGYEAAGQLLPYLGKSIIQRFVAKPVARSVAESFRTLADAPQRQLHLAIQGAKGADLYPQVERALLSGAPRVGQPPSEVAAGRAAERIITRGDRLTPEGAAQTAKNRIGQQVDAAARSGPDVDITDLKAEAQRIVDKIAKPETSFPRKVAEGADQGVGAGVAASFKDQFGISIDQAAKDPKYAGLVERYKAQLAPTELAGAQAEAARETLKHPAMGVLNRILNAPDTVPFYDAHLWKSELQDAIRGTVDNATRSRLTTTTARIAGGLRDALAGHEPYNEATAAYAKIAPLYEEGYGGKFLEQAKHHPESLVQMISPDDPTPTHMLHDLLVKQPASIGKGAEGQQAWDLVRSAWTYKHLLKGGISALDENIEKLSPEFTQAMYGDQAGQQVLQNLKTIGAAFKSAVTTFNRSSLGGSQPSAETLAAHGLRALILGPGEVWGGLSWVKLLTGPEEKDLIEWAAYSPANTRRLVNFVTGPSPTGAAVADFLRSAGLSRALSLTAKTGTAAAQGAASVLGAAQNLDRSTRPKVPQQTDAIGPKVGQPPPR